MSLEYALLFLVCDPRLLIYRLTTFLPRVSPAYAVFMLFFSCMYQHNKKQYYLGLYIVESVQQSLEKKFGKAGATIPSTPSESFKKRMGVSRTSNLLPDHVI